MVQSTVGTPAFSVMCRSNKSEKKLAEEFPNHEAMAGIEVADVTRAVKDSISLFGYGK